MDPVEVGFVETLLGLNSWTAEIIKELEVTRLCSA